MMNDELYDEMNDEMDAELYGKEIRNTALPEQIDGYMVSDIELCVERNTEYYLDCFRKQPKLSLNGSALVFSGNWMIYRHMWAEFVIWSLINIVLTFVSGRIFIKNMLLNGNSIIDVIQKLTLGNLIFNATLFFVFGNMLYWKKIKRELDRMNRKDSTIPMTAAEKANLQKRTRVSGSYVAIVIFLYMLLNGIASSVFIALLS